MDPQFYAASRLAKTRIETPEMERISAFFEGLRHDPAAQQAFFTYCRDWKLAPWIHTQLQRHDLRDYFDASILQSFEAAHTTIQSENERRNVEAARFLAEFNKAGIDVAILKGNYFAHTIYKDTGYKRMNDFDLLIRPDDWPKAQQVYLDMDYIPLGFGWSGEKQEAAKFSHTGIPFISRNFHCIIGTQWGLKSATTRYRVDIDEVWAHSLPFDFQGVPVRRLSPEHNLLHLVLHMGLYKCGIRDCMDVYNLLLAEPMPDPASLRALFERSNALDKAWFTLRMTDRCSDAVPDAWKAALKPAGDSFVLRRLNSRETAVEKAGGDIQVSYHDYFQDVEKQVIYFNLVTKFHEKSWFYGKILRMVFFPKREIALKLFDKYPAGSLLARLRVPFMVFALIAEEIGWTFTMLLFFKLFVDWLLSLRFYLLPVESYFEYLRKRGIDPKSIEKAVKNIQ